MYRALFPGGEIIGEAISILRDSYLFLSRYVDPEEGGRALVLAILSLAMTAGLMFQRRLGNFRTISMTSLWFLTVHGSMVTLFGLPWFVYPVLDRFLENGNSSAVVILMSAVSVMVGWGRECVPSLSGFRQRMSGRWGSDEGSGSVWGWSIVFFGILLFGIGLATYRWALDDLYFL